MIGFSNPSYEQIAAAEPLDANPMGVYELMTFERLDEEEVLARNRAIAFAGRPRVYLN